MVNVLPENEAVRVLGRPGRVPSSYRCISSDISAWRHENLSFVVTLSPLNIVNRSLSFALDLRVMEPGSAEHVAPPAPVLLAGGVDAEVLVAVVVVNDVTSVVEAMLDEACVLGIHCE
jgi:hypothetical protein